MTEEFTEQLVVVPMYIGQIDEDIFGKVDLYQVGLSGEVDDIFAYRTSEGLNEGVLDEFYILAPFSKVAMKATPNSASFLQVKAGEEPMCLFKVFFHEVGYFIELADANSMEIKSSLDEESYAWFTLPKIPARMVAELRKFFYAVEDKYGTEGIVVLTFDQEFRGTENEELGWGFAVPDQSNTAGHCNYEMKEIKENLPDHITIVGTVHSHPKMTAFASQTDHNDQAGFDGLHITYGWLNNTIEYYAELVRGKNFYRLAPEIVMDLDEQFQWEVTLGDEVHVVPHDAFTQVEIDFGIDDAVVEEWCQNVTKQTYTNGSGGWNQNQSQGFGPNKAGGSDPKALPAQAGTTHATSNQDYLPDQLPKEVINLDYAITLPDPYQNNLFMLSPEGATRCAACETSWAISIAEIEDRRQCLFCGIFIIHPGENVVDVDELRDSLGFRPFESFLDMKLPFVIWNPADGTYKSTAFTVGDSPKVSSHSVGTTVS